ncbi:FtsW/RodA/SpoVE family cell cycle protein [bacterium]|nr:MAG: FtsW/RodA/SpoVE family cell cycle protein [bacterium]MCL4232095.1 FtsW/RodA/SpoVE family cell cycle protein [Dehalococcoidia bacterium]
MAMTLRAAGRGFASRERNVELALALAGCAFAVLAWRALDAAAFEMPANSGRILTQFLVAGIAGHVGMRFVAPHAAPQVYPAALLLSAVGLVFVLRLAPELGQEQVNWICLGTALMVVSAWAGRRHYRQLRQYTYTAALAAIALLVVTGLFGTTVYGARLWLTFGGHSVQSTELIKLFMLVFLAGFLADEAAVLAAGRLPFAGRTYSALPYVAPLLLTWLMTMAALALLKDLGSIALLVLLAIGALYVATGRFRFVLAGAALLFLTALAGYFAFDHARARIDVWRDVFADEQASGYQTAQSLYAIQAGGITGEGLGMGDPQLIPAAETDYVFSAIGEELGLAGAIGLVMVYVVLLFAGLRVALRCPEGFGRLLAASASLLIAIQAAIIICGNLRLIPTTGITLPFVSYGGSSLVVNFVIAGLLAGISSASSPRVQT